ncbi:predicted protein [Histoplasma mississippiense (nom. inval.)]|uniref:predicted protein n=1 Tax=Ajellomyces capsulatus (strain NAm1 / WU24) TaxID=2059318 RepID=UPI000157BFC8|nr:predicted protein [Histoplasma mississippiense (nom. inval.)]EDN06519.1 predicted protein [Histoplasma mississippiense (nom. inval.)]
MSSAECNYEIYDKKLLAIIQCLDEWKSELMSVEKFKDHKNLKYFTITSDSHSQFIINQKQRTFSQMLYFTENKIYHPMIWMTDGNTESIS